LWDDAQRQRAVCYGRFATADVPKRRLMNCPLTPTPSDISYDLRPGLDHDERLKSHKKEKSFLYLYSTKPTALTVNKM